MSFCEGLNTSLMTGTWRGEMADLPVKPRLLAFSASTRMPSSSLTSVNGVS